MKKVLEKILLVATVVAICTEIIFVAVALKSDTDMEEVL